MESQRRETPADVPFVSVDMRQTERPTRHGEDHRL